jgi:hypothetical protein
LLGSPVPASTTGFTAGCTASAPMLSDGITPEPALALNTGGSSVSGLKLTDASAPAALVDFHTPPPVAPR